MRTSKNLVIIGLVVLVAVFLAAPSAFAKKQLADDELDLITAAGQPTVVQVGVGTISFSDDNTPVLTLSGDSQIALQGLIVNNIVGENQVASAINIAAVDFINGVPSQTNSITQSWGATKDWSSVALGSTTVETPGVATASTAVATQTIENEAEAATLQGQAFAQCGLAGEVKCAANKQAAAQKGEATSIGVTLAANIAISEASTKAGKIGMSTPMIGILSAYADQIFETGAGDVFIARQQASVLSLDGTSQSNLAALVLNNVSGLNQVASGINILGGAMTLPNTIGQATQAFSDASQSNTITQYRGTPLSRPDVVPVVVGGVTLK
jgi:hypothetical protein